MLVVGLIGFSVPLPLPPWCPGVVVGGLRGLSCLSAMSGFAPMSARPVVVDGVLDAAARGGPRPAWSCLSRYTAVIFPAGREPRSPFLRGGVGRGPPGVFDAFSRQSQLGVSHPGWPVTRRSGLVCRLGRAPLLEVAGGPRPTFDLSTRRALVGSGRGPLLPCRPSAGSSRRASSAVVAPLRFLPGVDLLRRSPFLREGVGRGPPGGCSASRRRPGWAAAHLVWCLLGRGVGPFGPESSGPRPTWT